MFTRREMIRLFGFGTAGVGTAPVFLSCGDELGVNMYDSCEEAENVTRNVIQNDNSNGIEINAPDRMQPEIAAHLHFLQEFSGEEVVNLINRITIYDPYRETCIRHEELAALGGFTDGAGEIYLRSEIVIRKNNYWPSTFTLPYTLAFFASYGGQANILSHELWHTISRQLGHEEEICQRYNNTSYGTGGAAEGNCRELDEGIANDYARYVMAAYLLHLNLLSSPVLEQFLLPSLRAGEVSIEEIIAVINDSDQTLPLVASPEHHERCLSLFIGLGFIKPKFEETLSYDGVLNDLREMYSRWREQANDKLSQM